MISGCGFESPCAHPSISFTCLCHTDPIPSPCTLMVWIVPPPNHTHLPHATPPFHLHSTTSTRPHSPTSIPQPTPPHPYHPHTHTSTLSHPHPNAAHTTLTYPHLFTHSRTPPAHFLIHIPTLPTPPTHIHPPPSPGPSGAGAGPPGEVSVVCPAVSCGPGALPRPGPPRPPPGAVPGQVDQRAVAAGQCAPHLRHLPFGGRRGVYGHVSAPAHSVGSMRGEIAARGGSAGGRMRHPVVGRAHWLDYVRLGGGGGGSGSLRPQGAVVCVGGGLWSTLGNMHLFQVQSLVSRASTTPYPSPPPHPPPHPHLFLPPPPPLPAWRGLVGAAASATSTRWPQCECVGRHRCGAGQ